MIKHVNKLPGLIVSNHEYLVPLDHGRPDGDKIKIFAREVRAIAEAKSEELPWLVFFQGGPGFASPRPDSKNGWLKRALKEYRVLLLDQRGTGLSTPVTYQTLACLPTPEAQAEYLKHFRADAIVQDAEMIRRELLGPAIPWSALGQSYGGFCLTHYLSRQPAGLKEVFITGGLPPLDASVDRVYQSTYQRVLGKNKRYYSRYPQDVELARRIVDYLSANDVRLPGGGKLSPRRFQQLGIAFGSSSGFESVHYLLENAFVQGANGPELSYVFLRAMENAQAFETNPIYAILHEAIYCQNQASNWSAARVLAEFPQFDPVLGQEVFFTGEMIYPWMFDEYEYLKPLKKTAEILAEYDGWSRLYDSTALSSNTVPSAAAVYYDDMYVETAFSENTAGQIDNLKIWVSNQYEHDAIRADGENVLDRLLDLVRGEI